MGNKKLADNYELDLVSIIHNRVKNYRNDALPMESCFVRGILDLIGSKWSSLLLIVLSERVHRFGELRRAIPDISQRMLTQSLRNLQANGLIERTVYDTAPPTVEYKLTPLGESLIEPITGILVWAEINQQKIIQAQINTNPSI